MMIGIVDYQVGNVGNVIRALQLLDLNARVINDPKSTGPDITALILPGVGAFGPAMRNLEASGWRDFLGTWKYKELPLLGICLGMQLMCEKSTENGLHEGLGFVKGTVTSLATRKLPHMGWNDIMWNGKAPFLESEIPGGSYFYFVHSYALLESGDAVATTRVEERDFVSIILKNNIAGFQFHPERSGTLGLKLLGKTLSWLTGERS